MLIYGSLKSAGKACISYLSGLCENKALYFVFYLLFRLITGMILLFCFSDVDI